MIDDLYVWRDFISIVPSQHIEMDGQIPSIRLFCKQFNRNGVFPQFIPLGKHNGIIMRNLA